MNFRLDTTQEADAVAAAIGNGEFAQFYRFDELERGYAALMPGWDLPKPEFPPTFKVRKGQIKETYNTKRIPAWCDRVLFKSTLETHVVSFASSASRRPSLLFAGGTPPLEKVPARDDVGPQARRADARAHRADAAARAASPRARVVRRRRRGLAAAVPRRDRARDGRRRHPRPRETVLKKNLARAGGGAPGAS